MMADTNVLTGAIPVEDFLRQVAHCYDQPQLKSWYAQMQDSLHQLRLAIEDAVETGDYDPDWLHEQRDMRKHRQGVITAIRERLEVLKQQQKLLNNENFEAYLIERVREEMGEEAFSELLEQARRDYRQRIAAQSPLRAEKILGL